MQQASSAFLIVEKGEPYSIGEALPLSSGEVLLGRDSLDSQRGFFFYSPFVSRRHAVIQFRDGSHSLTDLESRHGTRVNGRRLTPGEPWKLEARDRISLARDGAVLVFATAAPAGSQTWDYPEPQPEPPASQKPDSILVLDPDRREIVLDGKILTLSGKSYDLLRLLYENQGRAVSSVDIKKSVWKERGLGADGLPLVTNQELRTLVHRLRKRLEPHGDLICTVAGYGYLLDVE